MNLQTFKGKLQGAKKGYDLLKSKADALKVSPDFFLFRMHFFLNR